MIAAFAGRIGGSSQSIGRLLIACMALGFASLLAAGVAAIWATQASEAHTEWVNHSYDVEVGISRVSVLNEQAETTRRGYLLTGGGVFLDAYRASVEALPRALDRVARLTEDNSGQQANLLRLRQLIGRVSEQRQHTMTLVEQGRRDEAVRLFAAETGGRWMPAVRNQATIMLAQERQLLERRNGEQRRGIATFYTVIGVAGVILLLLAIVSLLAVMRYTRDLAVTGNRLHELNDTLEDQVAERTADLSRANEEIQRFAYIVSHDLRSPLVNVMGFTAELSAATVALGELVDRAEAEAPAILTEEARLATREDLPEAIGFIRTSTQKMDRLINAILTLARQGRRAITAEPLDIAGIAEGAVAAIRHIVDERGVTVTVERPMPRLVSDRLGIEQILSNLIENATKYLQPGRPGQVTVSASEPRGRVLIVVADNGRGIDPRDHQRVFDLFRRSGAQDQPGEGIGLAHVRAMAHRLGGTIDVQSTLGEGATFRLNLPAVYQAPQDATA